MDERGVREIDEVVEQQNVVAVVDDAAVRVRPVLGVSHGSLGMSSGFAAAGSPIQIQAKFQRSTSGYDTTLARGGMLACPGTSMHLPEQSKRSPW